MQDIPIYLIRLDVLLESLAGVISLVVSHRARIAYQLTREYRLSDLSTGFLVLAVAMFTRVIGTLYFFVLLGGGVSERGILLVAILYSAIKAMACMLFLVATRPSIRVSELRTETSLLLVVLPILVDPVWDMVATVILGIVTLQTLFNLTKSRSEYALYVFLGFMCLFFSHLSQILTRVPLRGYFTAQIFQFVGLVLLLIMVRRAGQVE